MFCKHGGKEINDNAFVCIYCGSLVKEVTTENRDCEKKTNGMANCNRHRDINSK